MYNDFISGESGITEQNANVALQLSELKISITWSEIVDESTVPPSPSQ